jgi:GT2 family glycosyltransferase
MGKAGVVVIGRNEGERLVRCLTSLIKQNINSGAIVYVDSGSTDGSLENACALGVDVVSLDLSTPFTAARARNAGFDRLISQHPDLSYVQFVDGDCEVVEDWIEKAVQALDDAPEVVAVCGWRRELYPQQSAYNRICDVEWRMGNTGVIQNFGGEVLIRVSAFQAVGGYNESVVAAEDDELSVRLQKNGGKLIRIDANSTLHDADMHTIQQWWKRGVRAGYGYAQVNRLHGEAPERKFQKDIRRLWIAGAVLPIIAFVLIPLTSGLSLLLLLKYPLTAIKVSIQMHAKGFSWKESIPWGISCAFSAFPGILGILKNSVNTSFHRPHQIIEYKGNNASISPG